MKKTTQSTPHDQPVPDGFKGLILHQTLVMTSRNGLHARPSALLAKTLRPYGCEVQVECGGMTVNGSSIMGLLALCAGFGSRLTFTINGREATRAMAAVEHLFATRFQAAYAPEHAATPAQAG